VPLIQAVVVLMAAIQTAVQMVLVVQALVVQALVVQALVVQALVRIEGEAVMVQLAVVQAVEQNANLRLLCSVCRRLFSQAPKVLQEVYDG
jgi:hypothetical protein